MKGPLKPDIRIPIFGIVIIEVAALLARAFLELRLIDGGESKSIAEDLSYLLVPPIMIVLLFPILRQQGPFLLSLLRRRDLTISLILLSVTLGIALRVTHWGGLIALTSFGVLRSSNPDSVVGPEFSFSCPEPAVLALSFFVLAFLTPIIEEVTNRGLILPTLLHRGRKLAIIVSSLLFAVVHDPQAIPLAFIVGLFLGLRMINMRTLWASIITHATYNAMTVVDWDCLHGIWNPVETTPAMIGTGMIALALALVSFSLCIVLVSQKSIGMREHPDP